MTIAACYLSAEGVVLGADSTTTMFIPGVGPGASGAEHHYNFAQKIYQVGENSTLGMTMWGLGNLAVTSYRTLIARFADLLVGQATQSLAEVAHRWNDFFWDAFAREFAQFLGRARQLGAQVTRTTQEEAELDALLQTFSGGFCLGGYLMRDRTPGAFEILYDPTLAAPGRVTPLALGSTRFWGCPNLINRLIYGLEAAPSRSRRLRRIGDFAGCGTRVSTRRLVKEACSMPTVASDDLQTEIEAKLQQIPPAAWVRDMLAYYRRTGKYRVKDLRRLLGDPNRSVEVGPNASLTAFLSGRTTS